MNLAGARSPRALPLVASLVVAGWLIPAPASAAVDRFGGEELSPRLAQLSETPLRLARPAKQAKVLGLAREGPGSLLREGGRVLVEVRFGGGAVAGVGRLRAAGARILDISRRYQTVTVAARPTDLQALAGVGRVEAVTEVLAPLVSATGCAGLVTSEGDSQLGAAAARSTFNLDGGGVNVGILSDSFDTATLAAGGGPIATHAANDVATGDLPGPGNPCGRSQPVGVFDEYAGAAPDEPLDEGRAMAQIVHDLAPGASISFATAFRGELSFASNIRALANAGADVIVDDVGYLDEPFFQEGPIAVAARDVTAAGASYFSAAGNDNVIDAKGRNIASWEAPEFRDSGTCPAAIVALSEEFEELEEEEGAPEPQGLHPDHCMDFDPAGGADETFGVTVPTGGVLAVDLQWAEPRFGVETDIDAFLLEEGGNPVEVEFGGESFVVGSGDDNVNRSEEPFEYFEWENPGPAQEVQLVINKYTLGGADPRLKFILNRAGSPVTATEYPESSGGDVVGPTVFGHSGGAGALAVGAVPYNNATAPEGYSSRGPVAHYFAPVTGTSAAPPLASPDGLVKPDLVATDCTLTTFFYPASTPGIYRFCGTSAAAPHAAGVVALMRQANPGLGQAQLRTALAASANPVGAFGPNAVGAGLVNAYGAVSSVALPPVVSITEPPPALGRNRRPGIGFTANRPVAFACTIDAGPLHPCSSPYVTSRLSDGRHGFAVVGTDAAGRIGTSAAVLFKVDARRPRTFFRRHPRKVIRTRHRKARAVFRFRSNEKNVRFICRIDGGLFRFCRARLARRFRVGKHVVRVKARDAAGNLDRTPAVFRFRVKRRHRNR